MNKDLGTLSAEITGVGGMVAVLSCLVRPNEESFKGGSIPTSFSLENAFFAIEAELDRIADDLSKLELEDLRKELAQRTSD